MSQLGKYIAMFESIIPHLTPIIGALAAASFIVLVSGIFSGTRKVLFQSTVFAASLAIGINYLYTEDYSLEPLWKTYVLLPDGVKFALSIVVIGVAYFGGAMYVAGVTIMPPAEFSNETPASCDSAITFTISSSIPAEDKDLFEYMFTKISDEIIGDLPTVYEMQSEAVNWIKRMIEYNVAGGKMNRGLATVAVHKTLSIASGVALTDKLRCQAAALGWCVEFLQAFFLVADDVMDDSVTRRSQPCWFRLSEVRLISINDSFILESCVYKILKRYFGSEKYYFQLVDLFIECTRQTELGQLMDLTSQPLGGVIDLSRFTLQRYKAIVKYKTAFYSFYLPVALGMIVSGITKKSHYDKAREILCIMGEYFQVQDDFLDCYGEPELIGKIGTDIQDNKCSWLVVQALSRANTAQRKLLEEHYGKHDERSVAIVKSIYNDLNMKSIYDNYEKASYEQIQGLLAQVKDMPKEVFEFLLRKIYKRSK